MAPSTCDLALEKQEGALISTSSRPAKVTCQGPVSMEETNKCKQDLCLSGAFRLEGDDSLRQLIPDKWVSGWEGHSGSLEGTQPLLGRPGELLGEGVVRAGARRVDDDQQSD